LAKPLFEATKEGEWEPMIWGEKQKKKVFIFCWNFNFSSFSKIFLLFICAYNVWVIPPHFPHPFPDLPLPLPLPPYPLATRQKLFCPYL
jgi:hypothetical protein